MTTHLITPYTILRDKREQHGWRFQDIASDARDGGLPWVAKIKDHHLGDGMGDYTLAGAECEETGWRVSIERKSLEDLYGTILGRRERFEIELANLNRMECAAVVVEADWQTVRDYTPIRWVVDGLTEAEMQHRRKSVFRSILAWQQPDRFPLVHWWMMPGARAAEVAAFRILERYWRNSRDHDARRRAAKFLLEELESSHSGTIKVPGRNGGYIRVPKSTNAEWYQRLCRQWERPTKRYPKPRTIIKRCDTIKALGRIIKGDTTGVYAERLLPFIEEATERIGHAPHS